MAKSSTEDDSTKSDKSVAVVEEKEPETRARQSVFRRSFSILGHLFHRTSKADFEKQLHHLSKEEAAVHTRLKRRSQTWRKLARGVIIYSIIMELLIVGIAVITTRVPELSWKMRAFRVLPVFAFPALASLVYTTCASYYRMRDRKDQKTLDRLRNERQAKIDELKERTNFYLTQQLIQKYDSDPAAKEAAARILASKLGAEAGLKLSLEPSQVDEINTSLAKGNNQDAESSEQAGLRRRRPHHKAFDQGMSSQNQAFDEPAQGAGRFSPQQRMEFEQSSGKASGGGWIARLAAMLVGEDPTQCYALICGNCRMHNGLARKEEFPNISYYCPHCNFFNGSKDVAESGCLKNGHDATPMNGKVEHQKTGSVLNHVPVIGSVSESVSHGSLQTVSDEFGTDVKSD